MKINIRGLITTMSPVGFYSVAVILSVTVAAIIAVIVAYLGVANNGSN